MLEVDSAGDDAARTMSQQSTASPSRHSENYNPEQVQEMEKLYELLRL